MTQSGSNGQQCPIDEVVFTAETLAEFLAEIREAAREATVSAIREAKARRWALPARRAAALRLH